MKHDKRSHHARPSQRRKTAELQKRKHVDGHRRDTFQQHEIFKSHRQEAPPSTKQNFVRHVRWGWQQKLGHLNVDMGPTVQSYACTVQDPYLLRIELHHRNAPCQFSGYSMGSSSTMMTLPPFKSYPDAVLMPAWQYQGFNYSNDTHYNYSKVKFYL